VSTFLELISRFGIKLKRKTGSLKTIKLRTITLVSTVVAASLIAGGTPAIAASNNSPLDSYLNKNWEDNQWHLKAIKAKDAWNVASGAGEIVAVIDTGVDANHPDLKGQVLDGFKFVSNTSEDATARTWSAVPVKADDMVDPDGHGTHVSGLIAAKHNGFGVTGVSYSAKILPISVQQVFKEAGDVDSSQALAQAVNLAVANNANVINMSLGGEVNEYDNGVAPNQSAVADAEKLLCDAISNAKAHGVVTVIAAGNSGGDGNPLAHPAYCEDAISVAATDFNNNVTSFSSFDRTVDISAPGKDVFSTIARSSNPWFSYSELSGTSMATPIVSGSLAVLMSAFPNETPDEIVARLYNTATDAGTKGFDAYYGRGIINLSAAIGVTEKTSTLTPAKLLIAGVRVAVGSDNNAPSLTVYWSQPVGEVIPNTYTVKVYDRYGSLYSTNVVDGNDVRYTFSIPSRFQYGYWVTVEANYDNETIYSTPNFNRGFGVKLSGVGISYVQDKGALSSATLTWNTTTTLESPYIETRFYGRGMKYFGKISELSPDNDGVFPSSLTYVPKEKDFMENILTSDFDINASINNSVREGMDYNFVIPAANPLAVSKNDYAVNKKGEFLDSLTTDLTFNDSAKKVSCKYGFGDCKGTKVQLTYIVKTKVKGKIVTKKYAVINHNAKDDAGYTLLTQKSPFDTSKSTVSVTLTAKLVKNDGKIGETVMPTKTIFENGQPSNLNCWY
jgi:subtilisin family serine protease